MQETTNTFFIDEANLQIPTVSYATYQSILTALTTTYGLSYTQITESASFSLAMVVRAALAYSAEGAYSVGIISDNLSSWVILAALRHLFNAGASVSVLHIKSAETLSAQLQSQLKILTKQGVEVITVEESAGLPPLAEYLKDSHNVLCGLSDLDRTATDLEKHIIETLNTLQTPVHCVQCPFGLAPDTGAHAATTLYASSTLSLGIPLNGLFIGNDFCGRNYICDVSIPKELYLKTGGDVGRAFASQPVIRIVTPTTDS